MSMLIRKGTLVRKPRSFERKSSSRKTRSTGNSPSYSHSRYPDEDDTSQWSSSVPPSPVAKFQSSSPADHRSLMSSPGKSSIGTTCTTSTVVSFNDGRVLHKPHLDPNDPGDVNSHSVRRQTVLQIEDAKKDAHNVCEFLYTTSKIVCSSTFMRSVVILFMIIPVVMIALGIKYLDDCPLEPRIPVYLLVGGCFWLLKIVISLWKSLQRRQGSLDNLYGTVPDDSSFHPTTYRAMEALLMLFLLSWHVLGSIWTLSIWRPRFKPLLHQPDVWCEQSLYLYTVAVVIGGYALIALWLLAMLCLACVYRSSSTDGGGHT